MSEPRTVNAWIIKKNRKYKELFRWGISNKKDREDGEALATIASKIEYLFEVGNQYKLPLVKSEKGNYYMIHESYGQKTKGSVQRRTSEGETTKKELPIELDPFEDAIDNAEVKSDVDDEVESYIDNSVEKENQLMKVNEQSLDFVEQIDRDRIIAQFNDYQFVMKNIVDKNDWVNIKGKQHLKKSGFIKLAVAFNISVEIVETIDLSKDGNWKYRITARATAPNERCMEAVGMCSSEEYTDKRGEHVIFATCETRAKVRAISSLMGMGLVSAEEMR